MRRRVLWRKGNIILVGGVLIFLLMTQVPSVIAAIQPQAASSIQATSTAIILAAPTIDPTITALNKEQLTLQVKQLQQTDDHSFSAWLWMYAATIFSAVFSTLTVVGGGIFALIRWIDDRNKQRLDDAAKRKDDVAKQEKERFDSLLSISAGLDDENIGKRIGAVLMLNTIFLRPGYEQFASQIFKLAVAHLRLEPPLTDLTQPQSPFSKALIDLFCDSFSIAQKNLLQHAQVDGNIDPAILYRELDAGDVKLDKAYLYKVNLRQIWMPEAFLRYAFLQSAELSGAELNYAHLMYANLSGADLTNADLSGADLTHADLTNADLSGATLPGAILKEALLKGTMLKKTDIGVNLTGADLTGADLTNADLSDADLNGAILVDADLSGANFTGADLSGTQPEKAKSLQGAIMRNVVGLTEEQRTACHALGASI